MLRGNDLTVLAVEGHSYTDVNRSYHAREAGGAPLWEDDVCYLRKSLREAFLMEQGLYRKVNCIMK